MGNRAGGCGNGMMGQPAEIAKQIRDLMNEGRITELNRLVSDEFYAVFAIGKPGEFETYDADQYHQGNIEAHKNTTKEKTLTGNTPTSVGVCGPKSSLSSRQPSILR